MSFSSSIKNDICRIEISKLCCMRSELIGIMQVNGLLEKYDKEKQFIEITTENAALARRLFSFFKTLLKEQPNVLIKKCKRLKKHNNYIIIVHKNHINELLHKQMHLRLKQIIAKECCKKAYLRGVFLGAGSVSGPEKSYHLEIVFNSRDTALQTSDVMKEYGLNTKIVKRGNHFTVYLKEGEHIVDFLNIIGAHDALMELENIRIIKEMRNNVNRIVNCETANLEKTINTSLRQIQKIEFINKHIGFENIPQKLREIAELRLKFHEASLKELGEMLMPPMGKSGVNHRLKKLEQIADEFYKN